MNKYFFSLKFAKRQSRGGGVWYLTPLSTIFMLYRGVGFSCGGNQSPREKPRNVASHSQTLSHNVISSTHRLRGIRTHNVSGDRH
jgi:hypothetical protein